jgi:hypothetical protein
MLFLGGWGRSGTTIIANILGSVSKVASIGEGRYLWDRGILQDKNCGCGAGFGDCDFWARVFAASSVTPSPELARRMTRRVGSRALTRQLAAMLAGRGAAYRRRRIAEIAILMRLYRAAFDTAAVAVIVDSSKTAPYALNFLGSEEFDSYFVHIVRDPRAVAYSWRRRKDTGDGPGADLFPQYTPVRSALSWLAFNLLAARVRSQAPQRYLRIRYEDFCASPQQTIGGILDFCGAPDSGLVWSGERTVSVRCQHSITGNPSRFQTGSLIIELDDEWRYRMTRLQRLIVTTLCWPLMMAYGYPLRTGKDWPGPSDVPADAPALPFPASRVSQTHEHVVGSRGKRQGA